MISILVAKVMFGGWWAVRWYAHGIAPDHFPIGTAFSLALAGGAGGGLLFTRPPTFQGWLAVATLLVLAVTRTRRWRTQAYDAGLGT